MYKKLQLLVIAAMVMVSAVMSQSIMLETFGVSPHQADLDTVYLDRAYNGLQNVGVETKIYLKATFSDSFFTAPVWSVMSSPDGSVADFPADTMLADDMRLVSFIPDIVGTYVLQVAEGSYTADITINAATYVGYDGNCSICHSDKVADWETTGHSTMLQQGLDGTLSSHYNEGCISCHTTGYDLDADNNGFDDHPFVFPDTLFVGMYDSMVATYPDAMHFANIQCESCHGPGSAHGGVTSDEKMVTTLSADNCAWCHDDGHYHIFPDQWRYSRHGNPTTLARGASSGCAQCHSGSGFVAWIKNNKTDLVDVPTPEKIACAVCHDPHSAALPYQLRDVNGVALNNGVAVDAGLGNLCMDCHRSRQNAKEYTGPDFHYSSHFGPHHGPQGDILAGENMASFGKKLPSSAHLAGVENACVGCHMSSVNTAALAGGHTFSMVDTAGNDNVAVCEECHGDIGETFAEKKFYFDGKADHDGDGVEEGLQDEVEGMLEELAMMLPPVGEADVDIGGDYVYTVGEAKAAYNYFAVEEDRSLGVHNPAFIVSLLKVSMEAIENGAVDGGIVAVEDVPNDQGKQVQVIWNKFADDGVAADPTVMYKVKRWDEKAEVWTDLAQTSADGSPRYAMVVPTLFDSTAQGPALTNFMVLSISAGGAVHMSDPMEGYSLDNLVPMPPMSPMTNVVESGVEVSWEETADPDVNYYNIYRSTTENFTPDENNLIGSTSNLNFMDEVTEHATYYYKINAIDFSGNEGEFSSEVMAVVNAIDENGKPLTYRLENNYPNPFNPSTTIEFAIKNAGHVRLVIFNTAGQVVVTALDEAMEAGSHRTKFDAQGLGLSSGAYFYRLTVTNNGTVEFQDIHKMLLLK